MNAEAPIRGIAARHRPAEHADQHGADDRVGRVVNVVEDERLGFVRSLGLALHYELAQAGIAVTVLQPGNVDTPVIDDYGLDRTSMPIRPQLAENAVRSTVKAVLSGKAVHIPGRRMALLGRLMPGSVSAQRPDDGSRRPEPRRTGATGDLIARPPSASRYDG